MVILVVAATEEEVKSINFKKIEQSTPHTVEVLITGVGMVAATYSLTKKLTEKKPDLVINAGLAGTFHNTFKIGDVVKVRSEVFADMGAEDDESFLPLDELGLMGKNVFPFKAGKLSPPTVEVSAALDSLKEVNGITVNKVHGNAKSIQRILALFTPDIETMEGAAIFYVCMIENIPCLQLRAISNKVEKRNRDAWNIPLALKNLAEITSKVIEDIK